MTSLCHWFNPENDTALAAGIERYTPPAAAAALREAGAALPLWYGDSGDMLMISGLDRAWYDGVCTRFDIGMTVWPGEGDATAAPWGWSPYTAFVLRQRGLQNLPSRDKLARLRDLSGRATCAAVVRRIHHIIPQLERAAAVCRNRDELRAAVQGPSVIKQAWSSSGRGLIVVDNHSLASRERSICNTIARDGYVTVETLHRRSADFAMLFRKDAQGVHYHGISVFETDARGAYTGNILAPQRELENRIRALSDTYDAVRDALMPALADDLAEYEGFLGVDMMTVADTGRIAVAEINLRRTMGHFATDLYSRHIVGGAHGIYRVGQKRPADDCVCEGTRIARGTFNLTPPGGKFAFHIDLG